MSVLAWILATPLLGALLVLLARRPLVRDVVLLFIAVATFLQVVPLVTPVLAGGRPAFTLLEVLPGVPLALEVEPLGLIFALLASGLWIVASLYSIGYMRANNAPGQSRFHAFFALSIAATLGVAMAGNLFTLFLFYEALTLATYPLVTHEGTPEARRAGRRYLGTLLFTSIALFLVGILWTYSLTGRLDFAPGGLLGQVPDGPMIGVLLALYVFGIGKAALMPVHGWLPAAMVAPTPVSALLHAVAVVKAGVFSVVKVIVYVFGVDRLASTGSADWLAWAAGFTVVVASLIALTRDNLKARLAYSTVSQLSYVVLAAALYVPAGIVAAAVHLVAHAFGKITLFFAAGAIYTAAHKTRVSELDGLGRVMPWTFAAFTVGALSMIGVPLTAGFLSKWLFLEGAMDSQAWGVVLVLAGSTVLNAGYFLPIVHRAFFRAPAGGQDHAPGHEAPLLLVVALSLTAIATAAVFFVPDLLLDLARGVA
ncbi:proton-conducting transporter membrane subunit [Pararhodospirillum photometricum]|nr:proton-conducting transporter membrane subunit [Pararhodospirillum photometricum]